MVVKVYSGLVAIMLGVIMCCMMIIKGVKVLYMDLLYGGAVVDVPSVDGTFNGCKVEVSGKQLCKAGAHGQTYRNGHSIL